MIPAEHAALEQALQQLGVPKTKVTATATQLDKRAHQLAETGNRTYEQALIHLLQLMKIARDKRTENDG